MGVPVGVPVAPLAAADAGKAAAGEPSSWAPAPQGDLDGGHGLSLAQRWLFGVEAFSFSSSPSLPTPLHSAFQINSILETFMCF